MSRGSARKMNLRNRIKTIDNQVESLYNWWESVIEQFLFKFFHELLEKLAQGLLQEFF